MEILNWLTSNNNLIIVGLLFIILILIRYQYKLKRELIIYNDCDIKSEILELIDELIAYIPIREIKESSDILDRTIQEISLMSDKELIDYRNNLQILLDKIEKSLEY